MENQSISQAIIENVFLLKDGSIVAGCYLLSGTVREGDQLYCVDGAGRLCLPVKVSGIVLQGKGGITSISASEKGGTRAAFRMADCKITDLHIGHMLQNEPEEVLYDKTPGWNALTACFEKKYPGQKNPAHFGMYACLKPGEAGPLDGISVYNSKDYFHFVTYGLSELYEKQNGNPDRSGFGFELTVRLKKEGLENPALEVRHMCSLLQMVAGITANGGHQFLPGQILPISKQKGLDVNGKSNITGFITRPDEPAGLITPFGKVMLIQLVGVTTEEMEKMKSGELTWNQVNEKLPEGLTDYKRA